jgi:hypothetical protein
MSGDSLPILLTLLVLIASIALLVRLILRTIQTHGPALPSLPSQAILFPIGSVFPSNDADAIKEACLLLAKEGKLTIALIYPVPRSTALDQAPPSQEELAALESLKTAVAPIGLRVETVIQPCRSALEEVIRLATQQQSSAIYLRLDPSSEGFPHGVLLERAPCALYLSQNPAK